MNRKVIGVVLLLISLPAMLALAEAVSFRLHNRNDRSLLSSGVEREYLLYVPAGYDPGKPAPLVISLHGAGGWGAMQRDLTGWNRIADEEGFVVAYPNGDGKVGKEGFVVPGDGNVWQVNRGSGLPRDVGYISDLIDALLEELSIDLRRIYVNGLSNGGGMSFVLSCTLSDRIAAVGLVGAAQTLEWEWCTDRRAVPMISFHGTADTAAPYRGGTSWVGPTIFPDVEEWTAKWARRNRCAPDPVDSRIADDVVRREYTDCAAPVVLYTIEGGGHTWPGGEPLPEWLLGRTSTSIEATREMWAFFREHPLKAE